MQFERSGRCRRAELDAALHFLEGKLTWIEKGRPGNVPEFEDYRC